MVTATWQRNTWPRLKTFSPSDNGTSIGDRLKSWRKKMSERNGWAAENFSNIWKFDLPLKICSPPDITGDHRQQGWKVVDSSKKSRPDVLLLLVYQDKSVPYLYLGISRNLVRQEESPTVPRVTNWWPPYLCPSTKRRITRLLFSSSSFVWSVSKL